ncbi:MAG TPA: 50S ribosomal protein L10 [Planctomycetota bacterium]|nr:50S ribosomal protein L10 [Planctomycetota bacterium]
MPSFINELSLRDLQALVKTNPSLIIVDPSKLKSADSLKLRKGLHDAGAKMRVAKVSLIRRAVPEGAAKLVDGKTPIGLVSAKDMMAAAKLLADLEKEEKLSVRGGIMDGQVLDGAQIKKIASLPSKQQLRQMLVSLLASPMSRLARVLALVGEKKNAGGAAA